MRGCVGLYIFCAVLTVGFSGASLAADGAAEYRAPASGVKLGPVQPAKPVASDSPTAPGQPAAANPGAPQPLGQQAGAQAPGASSAPLRSGPSGQPTPWPAAGGMVPYSSFDSLPGPASAPTASPVPNPAAMPGAAAAPPSPGQGFVSDHAPGVAPYAAPAPEGQTGDTLSGTGQMENNGYDDRGVATQYRDPQTGDIITSVVPPAPPAQQNYGTIFVAPQIYPHAGQWGSNPYGPMPRPGEPSWPGQQYMPPVIWQPAQPGNNRQRPDDRRYDDHRRDDRYDGPHRDPHGGRGHRDDERYATRPGRQGDSPYDQSGDRGRHGSGGR